MEGQVAKCEAYDCTYNQEGKCTCDGFWVDADGYCDGYEKEEKGE